MNSTDPIVAEVRAARASHAKRFHFDLNRIMADLREQERRSGRQYVNFPPRRPESHSVRESKT